MYVTADMDTEQQILCHPSIIHSTRWRFLCEWTRCSRFTESRLPFPSHCITFPVPTFPNPIAASTNGHIWHTLHFDLCNFSFDHIADFLEKDWPLCLLQQHRAPIDSSSACQHQYRQTKPCHFFYIHIHTVWNLFCVQCLFISDIHHFLFPDVIIFKNIY